MCVCVCVCVRACVRACVCDSDSTIHWHCVMLLYSCRVPFVTSVKRGCATVDDA